ncbi:hypothetical protein [Ruegeria arenilitoris]|uniref:hypothetical protein n=1 Tax=Ruegeria arenilitoris TaxID=1173585 RepID=UPI001480FA5C|nr:hypothetical protein [Ruegeria arenilitoris]
MKYASVFALIGGMSFASASAAQDMYAGSISCHAKETWGYVAEVTDTGNEIKMIITQNEPTRQQSWEYSSPIGKDGKAPLRLGKLRGSMWIDKKTNDNLWFTDLENWCVPNVIFKTTKQQLFDEFEELNTLNALETPTDEDVARWAELMLRRPPSFLFPPTEQGEVEAKLRELVRPQDGFLERYVAAKVDAFSNMPYETQEDVAAALAELLPYTKEEPIGRDRRNMVEFGRSGSLTDTLVSRVGTAVQAKMMAAGHPVQGPHGADIDHCQFVADAHAGEFSFYQYANRVGVPTSFWTNDMLNEAISELGACGWTNIANRIQKGIRNVQKDRQVLSEMMAYVDYLKDQDPSLKAIYEDRVFDYSNAVQNQRYQNTTLFKAIAVPAEIAYIDVATADFDAALATYLEPKILAGQNAFNGCRFLLAHKIVGDEEFHGKCMESYDGLRLSVAELPFQREIDRISALEVSEDQIAQLSVSSNLPDINSERDPAVRAVMQDALAKLDNAIVSKEAEFSEFVIARYENAGDAGVGQVSVLCQSARGDALKDACAKGEEIAKEREWADKADKVMAKMQGFRQELDGIPVSMDGMKQFQELLMARVNDKSGLHYDPERADEAMKALFEDTMSKQDSLTADLRPVVTEFFEAQEIKDLPGLGEYSTVADLGAAAPEHLVFYCKHLDSDPWVCSQGMDSLRDKQKAYVFGLRVAACQEKLTKINFSEDDLKKSFVFEGHGKKSPGIPAMEVICESPDLDLEGKDRLIFGDRSRYFIGGVLTKADDEIVLAVDEYDNKLGSKFGVYTGYAAGCILGKRLNGTDQCHLPDPY